MTSSTVAIVIPCYNESQRFPTAEFESFLQSKSGAHLLFVNDGSSDDTLKTIKVLSTNFSSSVSILDLPENLGKGEAIRMGVNHLTEAQNDSFDFIAYLDADLSTPLSEIMRFASLFNEYKSLAFIAGSRVKLYGSTRIIRFTHRHYFGRIIATLISESLGIAIYDTQCGAKIFKVELADQLFSNPFKSKWLFDVEIFFRLISIYGREQMEKHVMEIPVTSWQEKGQSKITFIDLLQIPFDLWKIRRTYKNN